MKIAVFSDTHGFSRGMENAVAEYAPDQIIHLGDGMRDAEATATDTMTTRRRTGS